MSDTKLTRSRAGTLGFTATAVAAGVGAVALFSTGHWVFGVLAGVFAFAFVLMGRDARTADCPACGSSLGCFTDSIVRCGGCRQYSVVEGDHMAPVKPGLVAEEPIFSTHVNLIFKRQKDPALWKLPLSGQCCVCGNAATRTEPLDVRFSLGKEMLGSMERIARFTFQIPHCALHRSGVIFDYEIFKFRSFDYWKAFEDLNLEA